MMSQLFVVRHGQASFMAEDYDQLSPLGEEQSRCLGEFWRRRGLDFDGVFMGPRRRHAQSWSAIGEGMEQDSMGVTDVLDGFDEHQVDQLLLPLERRALPMPEGVKRLWGNARNETVPEDKKRAFQSVFKALAEEWLDGRLRGEGVETWRQFQQRVLEALEGLCRRVGRKKRVLLVTSAGVLGPIFQRATGCSDAKALEVTWVLRNSSVSEFRFSENRFGLVSFNSLAHLGESRLLSYR